MALWQACDACGCLVADVDAHVAWHAKLVSLDPVVPVAPILDLPPPPPGGGTQPPPPPPPSPSTIKER